MPDRLCVNCGDAFSGRGDLCLDCVPDTQRATEPMPPARAAGRPALPPPATGEARCPHCAIEVTWDNVQRLAREIAGHREVWYFCPGCRATLEFAAWIEVPPRPPTRAETRHRSPR